ncbi:MAG: isoprenylcysteine carboxylmethyltransferase family protein [Opitutaceae bacterium]|nr:isoprenylcysteine carboxylmethyltransferase family protein [Verrucomicrobiales bacterium]
MMADELFWRRAVVCGSALIYWGGVMVQARRVRRKIGRSPNMKPRGLKESLLWIGWLMVIASWIGQPMLVGSTDASAGLRFIPSLYHNAGFVAGLVLTAAGYAGTLWCYAAMGSAWRIGVNRQEKNSLITRGPYGFIRHPIYSFQIVMLAGGICLLPTIASIVILAVHVGCVLIKAVDEESYLLTVHGKEYRDYMSRTGRLIPRSIRSAA